MQDRAKGAAVVSYMQHELLLHGLEGFTGPLSQITNA